MENVRDTVADRTDRAAATQPDWAAFSQGEGSSIECRTLSVNPGSGRCLRQDGRPSINGGKSLLVLLVFAALIGGAIGFALALPHGWLSALLAAQAGASVVVGIVVLFGMRR